MNKPPSKGSGESDTGVLRYFVGAWHGGGELERSGFQQKITFGYSDNFRSLPGSDFFVLRTI